MGLRELQVFADNLETVNLFQDYAPTWFVAHEPFKCENTLFVCY